MKISLILLILISTYSITQGDELDFTLPDGVDYKIQQVKEKELHLFRLSRHPTDEDHWGPDLPMLILMKMDCEDYAESISHFEGKTESEIEREFLTQIKSQLSQPVHGLKYSTISFGEFSGHRIQIDTQASSSGVVRKFTLLNSYIQNTDSCWMVNGMSLRNDEDIKTVDEILETIHIIEQAEPNQTGDDNSE